MSLTGRPFWRRVRGALRNALVWGAGWSGIVFILANLMYVAGEAPPRVSWPDTMFLAARFAIVGTIVGGAFSAFVGLRYHGRRLQEMSWKRFAIAGGIFSGVFVPLFLQAMNVLTDGAMVPWGLVLDDAVITGVLGAAVAGGSLLIAQRASTLPKGERPDALSDGPAASDAAPAAPKREPALAPRRDGR